MAQYPDKEKKFLDLKVSVFHNKKNGQLSMTLPKRELKKILDLHPKEEDGEDYIPKKIPIRILKWENK